MTRRVIFTDLDETLLDRETYSFDAARPALEALRTAGVPLVFVTTKTWAETRALQERALVDAACVIEDGGGIVVRKGTFDKLPGEALDRGTHELVPLSIPYADVRQALDRLNAEVRAAVRGFGDMSIEEVSQITSLPPEAAALARQREFDEPLVVKDPELAERLASAFESRLGLRLTRGGRLWHLHGDTDKGRAVSMLRVCYAQKLGAILTVGLGDSALDLPMLAEVDVPVIVPRRDGSPDPALSSALPHARVAPSAGPAGWNAAVLAVLEEG